MYKVLIAGDILPTDTNKDLFSNAKVEQLFGEVKYYFEASDCSVLNFEGTVYKEDTPIKKAGPVIGCSPETIIGIEKLKPTVVCLANNHCLDYGIDNFLSTVNTFETLGISVVGAGINGKLARKPFVYETSFGKLGIYNCAEYEFTISENKGGANGFDELYSFDDVQSLKKICDYVIVIYHGGKEDYRYVSPRLQKVCRKFVDCGADFVVTNHCHCISCHEKYRDREILYGQGNFLFDRVRTETRSTGLLVEISIEKRENHLFSSIDYVPLRREGCVVRLASDANEIMEEFEKRSLHIIDERFVEEQYEALSKEFITSYLMQMRGRWIPKITRLLLRKIYSPEQLLVILNIVRCQAHRELFIKGLETLLEDELKMNK